MAETMERRFYLRHFKSISHAISTYEDLNLLIRHIAEGVSRTFKIKGCSVLLYDERERQLFIASSYGVSDRYLNKGPLVVDDKHSVIEVGKPVYIADMQSDPRVQYPKAAAQENIKSMMSVPIKCRNVVTGVLRMYSGEPMLLDEDDVDSLCVITEQLGVVIENNGLKNFLDGLKQAMESLPLRLLRGL